MLESLGEIFGLKRKSREKREPGKSGRIFCAI